MSIAPLARDFSGTARLGLALAVASAIGYGTMITATRLSYDAGSNPLTLICARAAVPAAILALLMLARGSAFALRPGALWPVAGIAPGQIGRAHFGTPLTNAHLGCRLLLEKNQP